MSWPGREAEFLDSVDIAVGIAGRLGTTAFNALYGNRIDGASPGQQDELAAQHLAAAAESARASTPSSWSSRSAVRPATHSSLPPT